ncbi:DNA polymerase III subunit gamma/tau, partial [Fischerella thermalis]
MSYEPLHHKYRPKSFAELVGQEAIATTLTNAIRASKIAPAYLFTGPRGTGKTSSARILAKSLNCLKSDKPTAEPCGVCDVCQGITKGYSLDVIEIDAASNTGVDNIREIIERAQFAPVQCRYKVYVVDECHMLSTAAFNALLKTLEEPPKHVVFVLATTDPQRVLPTIISRCQRFDFRRIPLEAMVQHLSTIATKENININPEAITLVAQIAQGGLRDAESLLDQLSLLSGEVTPDHVWDLVGSVSERDLLTLLGAIATDNPEAVLDCTRQILDRGREPLIILQNLAALYRDLLIAKTAPSRQNLVACTPQTWQALVSFAQQLDISTILQGQQHLRTAELQLKNTTQPRLWLEVTLLGLLPSATIRTQPSTTNRVTPAVSPTPSVPPSPVSNGKVTQIQRDTGNQQNTTTQQHSNNEKSSLSPPTPPPSEQKELNSSTQESLEATWQKIVESLPIPA